MMMSVVLKQLFILSLCLNSSLSLVVLEQFFSKSCLDDNSSCV